MKVSFGNFFWRKIFLQETNSFYSLIQFFIPKESKSISRYYPVQSHWHQISCRSNYQKEISKQLNFLNNKKDCSFVYYQGKDWSKRKSEKTTAIVTTFILKVLKVSVRNNVSIPHTHYHLDTSSHHDHVFYCLPNRHYTHHQC